jgi:hypothetical protein
MIVKLPPNSRSVCVSVGIAQVVLIPILRYLCLLNTRYRITFQGLWQHERLSGIYLSSPPPSPVRTLMMDDGGPSRTTVRNYLYSCSRLEDRRWMVMRALMS